MHTSTTIMTVITMDT